MNRNPNTRAAAVLLAAALATSLGAFSAADATITSSGDDVTLRTHFTGQTDVCKLDTKYLPRSPDAVEGWLRGCPSTTKATASSGPGRLDVCKLDVQYLPRSPQAVEAWLRSCPSR